MDSNLELEQILESFFQKTDTDGPSVYQISKKTKILESTINNWRGRDQKRGPNLLIFVKARIAAAFSIDDLVGIGSHTRPGIDDYVEGQIRK